VASHVLSKELQLYYERVTSYITGTDERLQDAALKSVASDPGGFPPLTLTEPFA
jgi:hypothetical protein